MEVNFHSPCLCFKLLLSTERIRNLKRMPRTAEARRQGRRTAVSVFVPADCVWPLHTPLSLPFLVLLSCGSQTTSKNGSKLRSLSITRAPITLIRNLRVQKCEKDVQDDNIRSHVIFGFSCLSVLGAWRNHDCTSESCQWPKPAELSACCWA